MPVARIPWRPSLAPLPATPVLDDANRADGAIGGLWVANPDGGIRPGFNVASNRIAPVGAGAWMTYDLTTDENAECYATMVTVAGSVLEIGCCMTGAGTADYKYYGLEANTGSGETKLIRYMPGANVLGVTTEAWDDGDAFGLRVLAGGEVSAWRKPAGGEWGLISAVQDGAPLTGGGVMALYSSNGSAVYDDFGGGSLTGAAGVAPPALFVQRQQVVA